MWTLWHWSSQQKSDWFQSYPVEENETTPVWSLISVLDYMIIKSTHERKKGFWSFEIEKCAHDWLWRRMNLNLHTHHINSGSFEEAKENIYHSPLRRRVNTVAHSNLSPQFFPRSKSGHKPGLFHRV